MVLTNRSDLFQKLRQHLNSLKSYQVFLHQHCVEQDPHIHFICLEYSSVVLTPNLFLEVEVSAAVNILSLGKTYELKEIKPFSFHILRLPPTLEAIPRDFKFRQSSLGLLLCPAIFSSE